ncbi:MAG: riboflavin kinase/FMN adenylyltransferase [Planctomycetota bacterium]
MIVTFSHEALPLSEPPGGAAVVSIGVFDGVHLGHQAILKANVERARELGATSTVVTFRHHPKRVLLGRAPRTLTTLEHRLELFRRAGIEHTLAMRFDEELREEDAGEFTRRILIDKLNAECFVLGFDSKFGRNRAGGPESLRKAGHSVEVVDRVTVEQRAVSSTAIRESVELGDLERASAMLGRPVSIYGTVVSGRQLGRTLGFPTANLDLHHELHPPTGVYAAWAYRVEPKQRTEQGTGIGAVVNIGYRPTVPGTRPDQPLVETHLLDFDGELYGAHLEVEFVRRLREEKRFDGLDSLRAQIDRDVVQAREILALPAP